MPRHRQERRLGALFGPCRESLPGSHGIRVPDPSGDRPRRAARSPEVVGTDLPSIGSRGLKIQRRQMGLTPGHTAPASSRFHTSLTFDMPAISQRKGTMTTDFPRELEDKLSLAGFSFLEVVEPRDDLV